MRGEKGIALFRLLAEIEVGMIVECDRILRMYGNDTVDAARAILFVQCTLWSVCDFIHMLWIVTIETYSTYFL